VACGSPDDELVSPNDGLLEAPHYPDKDESSSGTTAPPATTSSGSSSSSSSGGAPNGFGTPDAGATPTCGTLWALTVAEPVLGLPAAAIRPTFSSDELTAYFVQHNAGGQYRIYAATRAARSEAFQPAVEMGPNVNGGLQSLAVSAAPSGLELVFNTYDGTNSQVLHATRTLSSEAFGAASLLRANAILEVTARDESVRFFARNVDGSTAIFQLRPASAPEDQAVLLSDGVPTWYEAESATLWFEQFFASPTPAFYPRSSRWDGAAWADSLPADMRVYWISPDGCRMYGTTDAGIVVRTRVSPP
jgi:hypothetical protein